MRIFFAPLSANSGLELIMNFRFGLRGLQHFLKVFYMVTKRLTIRGRVQGVGYRDSLCGEARRRGVAGWVRNRTDGSVEALVQGEDARVAEFIAWARRGPPAARVDEIHIEPVHFEGAHATFERRPSV
jgi:acylphosphatase